MKNWILSIVAIVFLTSILGLILPKGRTANLIKSIFSVLAVLVLIRPILSISKIENGNFNDFFASEITLQEDYLFFANAKKIENYENKIEEMIKEKGVLTSGVKIEYKHLENFNLVFEKIFLNINKSVISENKEHKNLIEEISNSVCTLLNVKKEILVVYG